MEAVPTMATIEEVRDELKKIFKFTELSSGLQLLDRLEYGKTDPSNAYFTDFVRNLPLIKFTEGAVAEDSHPGESIELVRGIRNQATNILSFEKKSGAWGNVRFGSEYVYKEIRVDNDKKGEALNAYYRDVLCEVVIQVILSCDPIYNHTIPKIINVFKRTPQSKSIWIQMEKLDMTFLEFITLSRPTLGNVKAYLTDLCNALEHFQDKYQFNHRDMKPDNLMIKGEQIKFIDFGYSILTFNGKQYSGTSIGGYSKYYFSKSIDLLMLSLYLLNVFMPEIHIINYLVPRKASVDFVRFLLAVIKNINKDVTLRSMNLDFATQTVVEKEIKIRNSILVPGTANRQSLLEYRGLGVPWHLGYNFKGEYLDGQFEFPFATPTGFLTLFEKIDDDSLNNIVNKATKGSTDGAGDVAAGGSSRESTGTGSSNRDKRNRKGGARTQKRKIRKTRYTVIKKRMNKTRL